MTYSTLLNGQYLEQNGAEVLYPGVAGNGYKVSIIAEGTGFGNAEPRIRTMNTLMTQGSWETLGPFGNRGPALVVEIEGLTADGLNAGEVWLSNLMGRGTLEWIPPGHTVSTVFDVVWCYIDRSYDEAWDLDETRWVRRYLIPIKALPNARSKNLTLTAAQVTGLDTQIDAGSSATGWSATATIDGSPATPTVGASGGYVTAAISTGAGGGDPIIKLRRTGTVSVTGARYIRIDWDTSPAWAGTTVEMATTSLRGVGEVFRTMTGAIASSYFPILPGVTSLAYIELVAKAINIASPMTLRIDQVRQVSQLPSITGRQRQLAITPGGSAAADGSLHVGSPATALGKVLLATYPLGRPSPALMTYRSGGTTPTTDATQINGARTLIQAADLVLDVPDVQVPFRGLNALWAKVQVDTDPATITWTVTPTTGGLAVGDVQTKSVVVPAGTNLLVPLGLAVLPGAETGADGAVRITLRRTAGTGVASVDEVWAFGQDEDSAVTIADAGTGTLAPGGPSNNLWVVAPTAERPAGGVLIGTSLTNRRWPSIVQSQQVHKFPPNGVSVLAVTCNATDGATDLTHYKRWTHHAAENS